MTCCGSCKFDQWFDVIYERYGSDRLHERWYGSGRPIRHPLLELEEHDAVHVFRRALASSAGWRDRCIEIAGHLGHVWGYGLAAVGETRQSR